MKIVYILLSAMLLISTQASAGDFKNRFLTSIQPGDAKEEVQFLMGSPDQIQSSGTKAGMIVWIYARNEDACAVRLNPKGVVDGTMCIPNPDYQSTGSKVAHGLGAIFKGMGDGLKNANANTVHCTGIQTGAFTSMNCQ